MSIDNNNFNVGDIVDHKNNPALVNGRVTQSGAYWTSVHWPQLTRDNEHKTEFLELVKPAEPAEPVIQDETQVTLKHIETRIADKNKTIASANALTERAEARIESAKTEIESNRKVIEKNLVEKAQLEQQLALLKPES